MNININLIPQFSGLIEYWADIPGYESVYQASNFGNIRSLDRVSARGKKYKGPFSNEI